MALEGISFRGMTSSTPYSILSLALSSMMAVPTFQLGAMTIVCPNRHMSYLLVTSLPACLLGNEIPLLVPGIQAESSIGQNSNQSRLGSGKQDN
jgi:hypothetical protein